MDLNQANELYMKSQQNNGVSPLLKRIYLEKAISLYSKEVRQVSLGNAPSLQRNIGFANFRLAEVLNPKSDLLLIIHHFAEALKAFSTAWIMKPNDRHTGWGGRLEELILDCFERSHRSLNGETKNFYLLDQLFTAIGNDQEFNIFRTRGRLANGQFFYRCGIKRMEEKDYRTTLRLVEYARQEYELALLSSHSIENKDYYQIDVSALNQDISFLKRSCDAVNLREQADQMFDKCIMQSEQLNFELIWDILDMYKASEIHCRGVDIENEAIILSRQGRIFHKVLKLQSKTHTYYRASFDLAQALFPRDVSKYDWFKECKIVLEELQKSKVREEENKKQQERAPYLEKMKDTLTALKAHSEDSFKLLKYVYTTHPPKVSFEYNEKSLDATNIKKAILKAIIQYHPDKQVGHEMEWRVLTEEITKYLNARYELLKGE